VSRSPPTSAAWVIAWLVHHALSPLTLAVGLVAVVVGFGAWRAYFDFAGHRKPRQTRSATVLWMLAHLPLTATVAATGAAMVTLVEHAHVAQREAGINPHPKCCSRH